jgi:hypothetical protein
MMVDIAALMKGLPVSSLEPDRVATIYILEMEGRFWVGDPWLRGNPILLLEPPAGQRVPYIQPVKALEIMLRRQGVGLDEAEARAREMVSRMRNEVADDRWVSYLNHSDFEPDSPECLPMPDFLAWLRNECHLVNPLVTERQQDMQDSEELENKGLQVSSDLLNFLALAAEVTANSPMFRGQDNNIKYEAWLSLANLPELPPPNAMIEFMPDPPWIDTKEIHWSHFLDEYFIYMGAYYKPFIRWREAIRPVALELEKALGEPVYSFGEQLGTAYGREYTHDELVHRFLVLHWCCTNKPKSAFVRYLLKISKARDVEELKAALIDPASYTHPFKMDFSEFAALSCQSLACAFRYVPPDRQKPGIDRRDMWLVGLRECWLSFEPDRPDPRDMWRVGDLERSDVLYFRHGTAQEGL